MTSSSSSSRVRAYVFDSTERTRSVALRSSRERSRINLNQQYQERSPIT
jgi:hypothetical protein